MIVYILKLYKLAVFGLAGLLLLIGFIGLIKTHSLEELQKRVAAKRHNTMLGLWALLTAVLLVVNIGMAWLNATQYEYADVSLNYNKASSGLNPNGTRYNASDILCDEVLQDAIDKGALPLTVDQLKASLSISSPVQGDSNSKDHYFISTQYRLNYNATKATASLNAETVLTLVGTSYKNWFINKFAENDQVFLTDLVDYTGKDYLDICDYLSAKAEMVLKYMNRLDRQESGFVSAKTGESFSSIYYQAMNIENVMIEKLRAYVLENGVSKDRNAYVSRLGFQNVFSYFDELNEAAKSRNAIRAISMFEDDMARIVLVPTYDQNDQFYMSETRIGIDDYAEEASAHANTKNTIRNTIATNNHAMDQLMKAAAKQDGDAKAEALVAQITAEVNRVLESARGIAHEFYDWASNGYMTLTVGRMEEKVKDIIVQGLEYTVLLLCAFACASLFAPALKKESAANVKPAQAKKEGAK